jgi:hypothetical protein
MNFLKILINLFFSPQKTYFEWHCNDRIIKYPLIDWCELMSSKSGKVNPFINIILEILKKASPGYFHPCPYFGLHELTNATGTRTLTTFMPTGLHKIVTKSTDGKKFRWGAILDFEFC